MKYVIIIDSVSTLPNYFLEKRPFLVMPVSVKINDELVPDSFSKSELIDVYSGKTINSKSKIESAPPSIEQISDLIIDTAAPEYDYALCQTISKKISATCDNFQLAANGIAKNAREKRNELNIEHSFHMNCINTGSTIAGAGLSAIYADMILSRGITYKDYVTTMQKFSRVVHCYNVVTDVLFSRARALDKGIESVSFPAALIGKSVGLNPIVRISYDHETKPVATKRGIANAIECLLDYASERIKEGLYAPVINLSYAGDPRELQKLKSFQKLLATAQKHKVKVLTDVMSMSAGVVFGSGALSMGIAPKDQKATP